VAESPRYTIYDPFAEAYNRHWGPDGAKGILPALDRLLLRDLPRGSRILDLCCGTGQLARRLTDRGFIVTGIDGSTEMLRLARKNAPAAELILADVRSFQADHRYTAVISTSNSLSHITSIRELRAVFRNTYAALAGDGRFLFDVHMEAGYKAQWHGEFAITDEDMVCTATSSYAPQSRIARMKVAISDLHDGAWRHSDTTIRQRAYTQAELISGMQDAGFIEVSMRDARRGQRPRGTLQRAMFVGRKPFGDQRGP